MRRTLVAGFVALAACSDPPKTEPKLDGMGLPDAPATACSACQRGQICAQRFDGTCNQSVECVTTAETCPVDTCSAACEGALCPGRYQCQNRPPCGTEIAGAFTCYGP